ncbi:hypothetical protein BHO_0900011 [Borrelia hermsii YBT]|nr:hypothetical protein BHO_0900011 [Borrelia hermsii YBT]
MGRLKKQVGVFALKYLLKNGYKIMDRNYYS